MRRRRKEKTIEVEQVEVDEIMDPMTRQLPAVYSEKILWDKTLLLYDSALKEINTKIEILKSEFKLTHQYNPIEHTIARLKSPQSIIDKLKRKGYDVTISNVLKYINDIAGVRIICSFTSDIYRIADLLRCQNDIKILNIKDYIMNPKPNGYSSYHMIVSVPVYLSNERVDTKVEIQIRTIAMDFWASLEHKMHYKFDKNVPEHIQRELKECADIVSFLDRKMLALNEEINNYKPAESEDMTSEMVYSKLRSYFGSISEEVLIKKS